MKYADRRVVTCSPENSETPIEALRSWITPNHSFYVRNHFETPELDAASWTLGVTGRIEFEKAFSQADLAAMPQTSLFATLECAGNGRSFLEEPAPGVQWGVGAVGNAEWTGVAVRELLDAASIRPGAIEVVFEGADSGREGDSAEELRFARSLPLDLALHPDTLIALQMNGEDLTVEHGAPARLVVPGWYGVASVKWLQAIRVVDEPFRGYYQSVKYTVKRKSARGVNEEIVGMMLPKAEIVRPYHGEPLSTGHHLIEGVAWAGPEAVAAVEVSCDGGDTWRRAELLGSPQRYSWTNFVVDWEQRGTGAYKLMARAISTSGEIQPERHNPLHGGYHINFSRPREVVIGEPSRNQPLVFAI